MEYPQQTLRIVVTSDLHYDPSGQLTSPQRIKRLVEAIHAERPDAVVIAGDIAHGLGLFRDCLGLFSGLEVPIGVTAGNHDVWSGKHSRHSSLDLWTTFLPQAVRDAGAVWLEGENLIVGSVAVVGSMVWYDYSAIDPGLNLSTAEIASAKRRLNNDAHMIDWPHSDPDFAAMLLQGLEQRLDLAEQSPDIREVLVATHVPIFEQQMLRKPHDPDWGLSNAYFGNLTAGETVRGFSKVRTVISGHTHVGRQGVVQHQPEAPIDCYVVPSEYSSPSFILATL